MINSDQDHTPEKQSHSSELRRLRILALVIGILIFIWLPFEDTHLRWVILFAVAIATWGAARVLTTFQTGTRIGLFIYPIAGALAGLSVTIIEILLMVFKNGLHGHSSPDFTYEQMAALLPYALLWTAVGLIIGTGLLLWNSVRRTGQEQR